MHSVFSLVLCDEQSLTSDTSTISDADCTDRIVRRCRNFAGAPGTVSIAIDDVVSWHGVVVVAVDVVAGLRILLERKHLSFIGIVPALSSRLRAGNPPFSGFRSIARARQNIQTEKGATLT